MKNAAKIKTAFKAATNAAPKAAPKAAPNATGRSAGKVSTKVAARNAAKPRARPSVPARRTNAAMSAETQANIIQAAIESLAEHGYAGTTMSGIANAVGVSRAALIYHFRSKNALMTAVINAIYDEMNVMYRAAVHPALTPEERLLAVFDVSFYFTSSINQMAQIELLLAARRDPAFRKEVAPTIKARDANFEEAWHQLTAAITGDTDGGTGGRERLDLIRDFAVSVFRGITINRSLNADTTSFDRQLLLLRKLLHESL